jgi:hypothetical protein
MLGKIQSMAIQSATLALAIAVVTLPPAAAQQVGQLSHQGAVTIGTPAATIGVRGAIGTISYGPGGAQVTAQYGQLTATNGSGPHLIITGFTMNIANWDTLPGPPFPTPPELVAHNIIILSSVNGQTGGGPPLNGLPTTGPQPQLPWLPTNTGENDATQIIVQGTQLATEPTPPLPPPPPTTGNFSRLR